MNANISAKSESAGPTGKIEFVENHRPALPSGDYKIKVKQSIKAKKPSSAAATLGAENALFTETFESQTREFSVQGPRFTLEPQLIRAVFPPAGSLGEHSSVLPHISFHRSTLPWERFAVTLNEAERHALETRAEDRTEDQKMLADTPKLKTPWLALLLFDQDELEVRQDLKKIKGIGQKIEEKLNQQGIFTYQKIAELTPEAVKHLETEIIRFPGRITREKWVEQASKLCQKVEAERTAVKVSGPKACTLEEITKDEKPCFWKLKLKPRAQAQDPDRLLSPKFAYEFGQQVGDPVTVIDVARDLLGDILPSMEDVELLGHVRQPTDDLGTPVGDQVATLLGNRLPQPGKMSVVHLVSLEGRYGQENRGIWNLPDGDFVRIVSLKNWRFTCLDEKHSFKGLLHYLNKEHLFFLEQELAQSLPGTIDEAPLSEDVRAAFVSHHLSVSKETTARLERDAWIVEDRDKHQRYLIRREKTEHLGVYENQKLLFKFDFPNSETQQAIEQVIEKKVRSQLSTLKPSVELSPKAKPKKELVEAWRVSDTHGSDYMIRKNGSKYEVHRSMPQTLRLPTNHLKQARQFVQQGYVPMPHEMRQGNRSVSWYRGPLAPGRVDKADESTALAKADSKNGDKQNPSEGSLRARSADQLVRYNPANGMFDVSYAAAWELGRLLTLQNEKVAVSLLQWKRRHRHSQERQRAMVELEHLPVVSRQVATDLPADVTRWFADLALLRGVPFNYLVPDERMLPQESIRFFWVDPDWIRCLHDGAFSIGRVLPSDHKRDADNHDLRAKPHAIVTGFLLRSEVVSGWPDLQLDGYDEAVPHENYEHDTLSPKNPIEDRIPFDRRLQKAMNNGDASALVSEFGFVEVSTIAVSPIVPDSRWLVNVNENETLYLIEKTKDGFRLSIENKLPLLRMERLSPNVLLCMFAGDIKTVDIHQKPEALHFGLNRSGEGNSIRYYRELKSLRGGELPGCEVDISWKGGKQKRVISIKDLNGAIQAKLKELPTSEDFGKAFESMTSAQFALEMAEGVQKVRFTID